MKATSCLSSPSSTDFETSGNGMGWDSLLCLEFGNGMVIIPLHFLHRNCFPMDAFPTWYFVPHVEHRTLSRSSFSMMALDLKNFPKMPRIPIDKDTFPS